MFFNQVTRLPSLPQLKRSQVGAFRGEIHRRPAAQHAGTRLAHGPALRATGGHGEDGHAGAQRGTAQDPRRGAELPRCAECHLPLMGKDVWLGFC